VDEKVFVAWCEDETAAQLEGIFAQFVLFVSGALGAFAGLHVIAAKQMEQGSVAQLHRFVGFAFFVDQQGEVDAGFLAKEFGVAHVAQSDRGQACALPAEFFFMRAQLRDVLAAEDSTVVTEENQGSRPVGPQGPETDRVAVNVGKRDAGQLAAERVGHAGDFQGMETIVSS